MSVVAALNLEEHGFSKDSLLAFYMMMMGVSGASSLGFIGMALTLSVEAARKRDVVTEDGEWTVSEVYSGGMVEWFIQLWGAIIGLVTTGDTGFPVVTGELCHSSP